MATEAEIEANVIDITSRLDRLRAVSLAKDSTAALRELEGLAHALRYLDVVLRTHLQLGEPLSNSEEVADYLNRVKEELLQHMQAFGLSPRKMSQKPKD